MQTVTFAGEQARHLRWAGGAMLGAGLVLTRLPAGAGLPCPLRAITGVPCPLCGMTTSVKSTLAGHLGDAVAANPAGVVAVVVALVLLAVRPERIPVPPLPRWSPPSPRCGCFELARFGVLPGF